MRIRNNNQLYNILNSLMILIMMIIVLFVMILENRADLKRSIRDTQDKIISNTDELNEFFNDWMSIQVHAVRNAVSVFSDSDEAWNKEVILNLFVETQLNITSAAIIDHENKLVLSSNSWTEGLVPVSDHSWLSHYYNEPLEKNYSLLNFPISRHENQEGFAFLAILDMDVVSRYIQNLREGEPALSVRIMDAEGKPLNFNSDGDQDVPDWDSGFPEPLGNGVVTWYPDVSKSTLERYIKSYFLYRKKQNLTNWTIELSHQNLNMYLELLTLTKTNLRITFMAFLFLLLLLRLFSWRLTRVLDKLVHYSALNIYGKSFSMDDTQWPRSSVREFDQLSHRLHDIMSHQKKAADLLSRKNEKLSEMNTALIQSEENLRITLNSISNGVFSINKDSIIISINPIASDLCAWEIHEAIGTHVDEVFILKPEHSTAVLFQPFKKILQNGLQEFDSGRYTLINRKGYHTIVELDAAPIEDRNHSIVGAVIVLKDLSEKREMEEKLRQSQKMEIVGQLASGISHDFNNLLAGLLGSINLLQLDIEKGSREREHLDLMEQLIKRASNLTGKLLSFSRKGKLIHEEVNIHSLILDLKTLLEHTFPKNIKIQSSLTAQSSMIQGDPTEIQRVLMNIALNSRDALKDGGEIHFQTWIAEEGRGIQTVDGPIILPCDCICIQISDTGPGIDDEVLPHIFEPFFTTKEQNSSSGLGLSAVYGSILEHKGFIYAESVDLCSFYLYYPLPQA